MGTYTQIIDNHLWPIVAAHVPSNDYLFQDDNAPVLRVRSVKEYIYMEQENILTMELPPQSPDLNIIENFWRNLTGTVLNGTEFKNRKWPGNGHTGMGKYLS